MAVYIHRAWITATAFTRTMWQWCAAKTKALALSSSHRLRKAFRLSAKSFATVQLSVARAFTWAIVSWPSIAMTFQDCITATLSTSSKTLDTRSHSPLGHLSTTPHRAMHQILIGYVRLNLIIWNVNQWKQWRHTIEATAIRSSACLIFKKKIIIFYFVRVCNTMLALVLVLDVRVCFLAFVWPFWIAWLMEIISCFFFSFCLIISHSLARSPLSSRLFHSLLNTLAHAPGYSPLMRWWQPKLYQLLRPVMVPRVPAGMFVLVFSLLSNHCSYPSFRPHSFEYNICN